MPSAKFNPEQEAVHELANACRRLETSLRGRRSEMQVDECRRQTVFHMAAVLEEFGLTVSAEILRQTGDQFCRPEDMK